MFGLVVSLVAMAAPLLVAAQDEGLSRNFTISNGQIYTPGLAILNSPQPGTPMGGDDLHISIDVTANGELPLPPVSDDSSTQIFNITVFLSSYDTGRNFTITNGTATPDNSTLGDIMLQQEGSTVKHIDWVWPDCLVGDGQPEDADSDRGVYNISIRQNFRLNDEDHYTIFDVPIAVTNSISDRSNRPDCDAIDNPLLEPEELDIESANALGIPLAPGSATELEVNPEDFNKDENSNDKTGPDDVPLPEDEDGVNNDEFGRLSPEARPGDALGGVGVVRWDGSAVRWVGLLSVAWTVLM